MAWTIDNALSDKAIERTEKTDRGYSFWLKGVPTEIQVTLSQNPAHGGYNFHLSHFIHTPTQAAPYCPSWPWGNDDAYALHLAVTAITQYYNQAVAVGLDPSPNWLVENDFR